MNATTKTEFVLRFDIGNDATLGAANIAEILQNIALDVERSGIEDNWDYRVRDHNGNTVGRYGRYVSVTPQEPAKCTCGTYNVFSPQWHTLCNAASRHAGLE